MLLWRRRSDERITRSRGVWPPCTQSTTPSALAASTIASVTASTGGESKITYANFERTSWISDFMRSEASSSDGFGGVGPAGTTDRFGEVLSWGPSSSGKVAAGQ